MVNTNYVIDLANEDRDAVDFARLNLGYVCASRLVFYEVERGIEDPVARREVVSRMRRALRRYGVRVLGATRERLRSLLSEAAGVLEEEGLDASRISMNTLMDTAYILLARSIGADLVTGDWSACKRAIRLGVCCLYTRAKPWMLLCSPEQLESYGKNTTT